MNISRFVIAATILFSFIVAISLYAAPCFPQTVASHWNINGEVDGYLPKFWALFLMPFISLALLLLFIAIPKIDPLKENIEKFRKHYEGFVALITLFLFYLYGLTIAWNVGFRFSMPQVLAPAFVVLFFYIGVLMENSKRNWFIGIRTPWTLESDAVWEKTHKLAAKIFKVAGLVFALGLFLPNWLFWVMMVAILCLAFVPVVYSYLEFRKEKK